MTFFITKTNSVWFPVKVTWNVGSGFEYSAVFTSDEQATYYIHMRYAHQPIKIVDRRKGEKANKTYFKRGANIPKQIRNRTYYNMKHYNLDLYDAFKEAVRDLYSLADEALRNAWYYEDFREYIPSEYVD